jgi:hypothetical membrane protein
MRRAFTLAAAGAALFVLLTTAAMFIYPGGTFSDPTTQGYRFSENFISELGFLTANNGERNPLGAGLFFLAMNLAGASLVLFFVTFWRLFRQPAWLRWLAGAGTLLGVLAGLCFMGVGFTPADVLRAPHIFFVVWAFRLFPAAVALYTAALFAHPTYPRRGGWLFVIFTACLVGYILLLELGPAFFTDADGMRVQVAGQKVIVYCSLVCVMLQAWVARGELDR